MLRGETNLRARRRTSGVKLHNRARLCVVAVEFLNHGRRIGVVNGSPAGGSGGGGQGSQSGGTGQTAGTVNTGGGGGGGQGSGAAGANGGRGIIIFRYADTFGALTVGGNLTYTGGTPSGGFRTYTFTNGTDTITFV